MSLTPTDFCRNTAYACSKHRSLHASSKEAQLTGSHKTYGICFTSFPFTFPFRFVYEILQRAHLLWTPTVTSFYGGVACINHALCIASDLLLVRSSLLLARAREDNLRMRWNSSPLKRRGYVYTPPHHNTGRRWIAFGLGRLAAAVTKQIPRFFRSRGKWPWPTTAPTTLWSEHPATQAPTLFPCQEIVPSLLKTSAPWT